MNFTPIDYAISALLGVMVPVIIINPYQPLPAHASGLSLRERFPDHFAYVDTGCGTQGQGQDQQQSGGGDQSQSQGQGQSQNCSHNGHVSSAPGPLGLAGVGAAWGWSRKLRRRIKP